MKIYFYADEYMTERIHTYSMNTNFKRIYIYSLIVMLDVLNNNVSVIVKLNYQIIPLHNDEIYPFLNKKKLNKSVSSNFSDDDIVNETGC